MRKHRLPLPRMNRSTSRIFRRLPSNTARRRACRGSRTSRRSHSGKFRPDRLRQRRPRQSRRQRNMLLLLPLLHRVRCITTSMMRNAVQWACCAVWPAVWVAGMSMRTMRAITSIMRNRRFSSPLRSPPHVRLLQGLPRRVRVRKVLPVSSTQPDGRRRSRCLQRMTNSWKSRPSCADSRTDSRLNLLPLWTARSTAPGCFRCVKICRLNSRRCDAALRYKP